MSTRSLRKRSRPEDLIADSSDHEREEFADFTSPGESKPTAATTLRDARKRGTSLTASLRGEGEEKRGGDGDNDDFYSTREHSRRTLAKLHMSSVAECKELGFMEQLSDGGLPLIPCEKPNQYGLFVRAMDGGLPGKRFEDGGGYVEVNCHTRLAAREGHRLVVRIQRPGLMPPTLILYPNHGFVSMELAVAVETGDYEHRNQQQLVPSRGRPAVLSQACGHPGFLVASVTVERIGVRLPLEIGRVDCIGDIEAIHAVETVEKVDTVGNVGCIETIEKIDGVDAIGHVGDVEKIEKIEKIDEVQRVRMV